MSRPLAQISRATVLLFMLMLSAHALLAINELGKAPEPSGSFDAVSIPLKGAGNLILLEVEVDGQMGFFILDTGAPYLVLNQTYFNDGRVVEQRIMSDVTGYTDTINVIRVGAFKLRDLLFEDMEADLTDLGSIENSRGIKILGLMGLNMFLKLEMRINLRRLSLELHRLNEDGKAVLPLPSCASSVFDFDFKVRNSVILVKGSINGKRLNLALDTGAETAVLSNNMSNTVFQSLTITNIKPLIGSSGESLTVLYGCIDNFMVGDIEVSNCKTVIANLEDLSIAYGSQLDGIIGYDLLAQGLIVINFDQRTLTFCSK